MVSFSLEKDRKVGFCVKRYEHPGPGNLVMSWIVTKVQGAR
jgi:hypothetical protein